jgi:hypothetical protein
LTKAAADAREGVQESSFYRRVLESLKRRGHVPADLTTLVNQVRILDLAVFARDFRRGLLSQAELSIAP